MLAWLVRRALGDLLDQFTSVDLNAIWEYAERLSDF